ncbi:hypothetical protein [uncultured Ruegeria sp.]|uniref:hypothetical protein n=1 Tax=uncultured Ruegeria sp. TaxID=259304 RepID=UPI00260D037A|nr:hypothetical protein [uncultured Ruegeria sp.]
MAEGRNFSWLRVVAVIAIIALFTADYAFDLMAKAPPWWAYAVCGLLALGIEEKAVGRLVMQIIRAVAKVPQDEDRK